MIPSAKQILDQIVKAHKLHPDWTISRIASELGYSPLFIIEALHLGEEHGDFKRDEEKDMLVDVQWLDRVSSSEQLDSIYESVHNVVSYFNAKEMDIEEGLMWQWLNGVRPLMIEFTIDDLVMGGKIVKYDLTDPKDEKSVYTFLTLPENKDKQYGRKQFKVAPEKE